MSAARTEGVARLGKRTKDLTKRLQPGDIAIIDHEDIDRVAADVMGEAKLEISYLVGTMIELPRAALCADAIAEPADFFSFGTNDLTQTTLGVSRDDAARFLGAYVDKGIYAKDPFVSLDVDGVGELRARSVREGLSRLAESSILERYV